ncbi:MAG: hypothetical protein A2Z20_00450 [Bdellovibrionales bacterium RBG_16_40_8]|nr:MAG: hypothetical protein A2Z20_00450 [Bdellovibrionales bacterium RBG_16_40_8]
MPYQKKPHTLKIGLDADLAEELKWLVPGYSSYRILKKSVDARNRHNPHFMYSVEVYGPGESPQERKITVEKVNYQGPKPIIIGSGPAGLFSALRFVERGVPCRLFERGSDSVTRMKAINRFWRYGELNPQNNVCFGEGGAGLYSDGKLISRIKSPYIPYVMNRLVKFGAPEEIEYLANPHVGSDRIRRVIPKIREFLLANGCEIFFDTQITQILTTTISAKKSVIGVKTLNNETFHTDKIILATGHSAEDMFYHLAEIDVAIEGKSFAVGLRIEHPQKLINQIQYREAAEHPKLGAANYRLAYHNKKTDIGIYSFCMCPGGYVLSCNTEENRVVCNGMSNYSRNSQFANAAIVVSVDHEKTFGSNIWGGLNFRRELEEKAMSQVRVAHGTNEIPAQRLIDFLAKRAGQTLPSSSPSGVKAANLHELLPENIFQELKSGIEKFDSNMHGFISDQAQLHGVESRTSCPIRITRDKETLQSITHEGLYPCGEGAGYAGGITSAACDGIKVVEKILNC